jgi:DNA repair ATPase RecN
MEELKSELEFLRRFTEQIKYSLEEQLRHLSLDMDNKIRDLHLSIENLATKIDRLRREPVRTVEELSAEKSRFIALMERFSRKYEERKLSEEGYERLLARGRARIAQIDAEIESLKKPGDELEKLRKDLDEMREEFAQIKRILKT